MADVRVRFGGAAVNVPAGVTILEAARLAGVRALDKYVVARVDEKIVDLSTSITQDQEVQLRDLESEDGLFAMRHSTAHLMAQAIKRLFPDAKISIGPVIENGFYYDIDLEHRLSEEDLERIEAEMEKARQENFPIERAVLKSADAREMFAAQNETYKVEIIDDLGEPVVSTYTQGDFTDLCRGPHVPSTGRIGAFKLLSIAGAYWRGDEKRQMLQRIYGTAFADGKRLRAHLTMLEEARKRDHRKVGKELDLFFMHPLAPASPFFMPKGAWLYNQLVAFIRKLYGRYGYDEVITPQIFDAELWHTSGHYENYKENMFLSEIDGREFGVKPMNCPGHALMYASTLRSYRDLPIRYADFGRLHRYERSGVTHGLTRVRSFAQDDAHIFCVPEQIAAEMTVFFRMVEEVYSAFGFEHLHIGLGTRPKKAMGDALLWDRAEATLKQVLSETGRAFDLNEGDGAFYGPKIDFRVTDAIGRHWQLATVQLDFQLPERFDLTFIDRDGKPRRPVMIHRAVLGSVERFLGILIEHFGGAFPFWIAPQQVAVLPIGSAHLPYGNELSSILRGWGYRVFLDERDETLNQKIRQAQQSKIPVMLVVGDKEVADRTANVRLQKGGERVGTLDMQRLQTYLAEQPNPLN